MGNNDHKIRQSEQEIDKDRIHHYAKKIPKEIKYAIKGLDEDTRLAIIGALMEKGRMSFTELKNTFGISSSSLSHHLTLLQDGGLVNNSLEIGSKEQQRYSYYKTTDITELILTSLSDTIFGIPRKDESRNHSKSKDDLMQQKLPTADLEALHTTIDNSAHLFYPWSSPFQLVKLIS